jgi:curved DNA-binding protein CbpA
MPDPAFRGNPYLVLDVRSDTSTAAIKRRWRELAREHHPDRAAGDAEEAARLTTRMARINAAYDLLRDPARRARFDSSPEGRRARAAERGGADARASFDDFMAYADAAGNGGPPPPPPTPPVTARYDTSASFRPRNSRLHEPARTMRGHAPPDRRSYQRERDLRASTPTGPVQRRRGRPQAPPSLQEARETVLNFGRFHGYTLGEVELLEPAYLDWVARTITRDRDLVQKARVIQADLDRRGVERRNRPAAAGFGDRAAAG